MKTNKLLILLLTAFMFEVFGCTSNRSKLKDVQQEEFPELTEVLPEIQPVTILYLGSYHMSNPGADAFNLESDDVLVPKRQLEIQNTVELLGKFKPTKIAIEAPKGDNATIGRYLEYVEGNLKLRRSEEEQIGFRLAKQIGHESIYPIDVKMPLNNTAVSNLVGANPQQFAHYMSSLEVIGEGAVNMIGDWLKTDTIGEVLYKMNEPEFEKFALEIYFRSLLPLVKENDYAGADVVTDWYHRNLRIFSNLHQISVPGDRILVVYGQGHIPLLKQFAKISPYFELEDVRTYLTIND